MWVVLDPFLLLKLLLYWFSHLLMQPWSSLILTSTYPRPFFIVTVSIWLGLRFLDSSNILTTTAIILPFFLSLAFVSFLQKAMSLSHLIGTIIMPHQYPVDRNFFKIQCQHLAMVVTVHSILCLFLHFVPLSVSICLFASPHGLQMRESVT